MPRLDISRLGYVHLASALLITSLAGIAAAGEVDKCDCETEGEYGTHILWVNNPSEARKRAREQKKLLMVMQLSGDFTQPTFT